MIRFFAPTRILASIDSLPKTSYLVVGAGLAGCLVTWRLLRANQRVLLVGSSDLPSASGAAAGIISPVTGRWMTKSWRIERFLPEARATYRELEVELDDSFFHPLPGRRYFQNGDDARRAARRLRNPRYAEVLSGALPAGSEPTGIRDRHGSVGLRECARVDLPRLLKRLRAYFVERGALRDAVFRHAALTRRREGWRHEFGLAERIVFCEGAGLRDNPRFAALPLKPVKGETLTLRADKGTPDLGFHHAGKWILSYGDGSFRTGATHEERDASDTPTAAAREALLQAAASILEAAPDLSIEDQSAGLRPATADARPLLGPHPSERGLFVFNGLGSKGAVSAPWLSRHLTEHLLREARLDPAVDIARYSDRLSSPVFRTQQRDSGPGDAPGRQ